MIIVNLWGGPGTGKSTLGGYLFTELKKRGIVAELLMESARWLFYTGRFEGRQINQILNLGLSFGALKDIQKAGAEVVISDSPLLMAKAYSREFYWYPEFAALLDRLSADFMNYDVLLKRIPRKGVKDLGRKHGPEMDAPILEVCSRLTLDLEIEPNSAGHKQVLAGVLQLLGKDVK